MKYATIVLGVVVILFGLAIGYESFVVLSKMLVVFALSFVVLGFNVLTRGLIMSRHPLEDVSRRPSVDTRPQGAGRPCARCGEKIMFASEGYTCATCEKPCHGACRARHELMDHGDREPTAYR